MHKASPVNSAASETPVSADMLASLLIERAIEQYRPTSMPDKLTPRIYAVMAATTLLTFATLTAGYQLLFSHHLFA